MAGPLRLVEIAHASDVGRVRTHNEDRSLAAVPVIAVADGMGGAKAGEVAAQMAVEAVAAVGSPVSQAGLRTAIEQANRDIRRMADADPEKAGMGTTLTAATLEDGRLSVLHVGDSRAYLWRDGTLHQLTHDHSMVAELVRRGTLSPQEAERHPHRNVITRALGAEPEVQIDALSQAIEAGDVVLICSDGLSTYVPDERIAETLAQAEDLAEAVGLLVDQANAAGGVDNITVVLARVGSGDTAAPDDQSTAEHPRPPARRGGDTSEQPRPAELGSGHTAEMRVLGGVRGRASQESARTAPAPRAPRVLEPAGRRRSRLRPAVVAVGVLLIAVTGAVAWVGSRTFVVEASPGGQVRVAHGLPVSIGPLDLSSPWQDTGVPADPVRADRAADFGAARGQGEAVAVAARLVWRYGLPEIPAITALPAPPRPAAARAGDATP